jgi:hypothetical protein
MYFYKIAKSSGDAQGSNSSNKTASSLYAVKNTHGLAPQNARTAFSQLARKNRGCNGTYVPLRRQPKMLTIPFGSADPNSRVNIANCTST